MSDILDKGLKKIGVTISKPALALIAIVLGIILIVFREYLIDFLLIIVGVFFIIEGILMFTDYLEVKNQQNTQPPQTSQTKS